eukprot:1522267-Rhodomonas_salina.1
MSANSTGAAWRVCKPVPSVAWQNGGWGAERETCGRSGWGHTFLGDREEALAGGLGGGPLVAGVDPVRAVVAAVEVVAVVDGLDIVHGQRARVVVVAEDHLHEACLAAVILVRTPAVVLRARHLQRQSIPLLRNVIRHQRVLLRQNLHRRGAHRARARGVGAGLDVAARDAALEGEAARGARGVEGADGEQGRGRLQHRDALPALHVELERAVELVAVLESPHTSRESRAA